MPHKHKRKRDDDTSSFNLPPTSRAKPLAAYSKATIFSKDDDAPSNKRRKSDDRKSNKLQDDTPKAFARLMAWQATGKRPNGLDDGTKPAKKKRKDSKPKSKPEDVHVISKSKPKSENTTLSSKPAKPVAKPKTTPAQTPVTQPTSTAATPVPKILPGETLSSFALRVDQTLPLSSISRNTNPNLPADLQAKLKKSQRVTKHNKRLQRMQADWRDTEAKLREKEADDADDAEDHKEEEDLLWSSVRVARDSRKGKKKRAAKGDADDDPWKDLEKRRREETKQKNLQDVVLAPPVLKKVKAKLKVRAEDFDALDGKQRVGGDDDDLVVDVGSVPGKVGSLRRREELNATRRAVIEGYRKMQGKKRGVGERLSMSRAVMT